jgi:uncharacterized protein YjbJ (UPF0337 family)
MGGKQSARSLGKIRQTAGELTGKKRLKRGGERGKYEAKSKLR